MALPYQLLSVSYTPRLNNIKKLFKQQFNGNIYGSTIINIILKKKPALIQDLNVLLIYYHRSPSNVSLVRGITYVTSPQIISACISATYRSKFSYVQLDLKYTSLT